MPAKRRDEVDVDGAHDEAFGLSEEYASFTTDWHAHDKHQILFAARGVMTLTVAGRHWTLPPLRAAWIPAGERHLASSATGISLRTVYLARGLASAGPDHTRVFGVSALAREMLIHAMRWGPSTSAPVDADPTRRAFFLALAGLTVEWIADEKPYFLPTAKTPELARAMEWTREHLEGATAPRAAKTAHLSVRTLTRRFADEAQTTFRDYLQAARMMRAMELLAQPGASVSATAFAVGFQSIGAFTTAFRERSGETPTEYRTRVAR
jgi:AraC-like DNA-binding protein